MAKQQPFVLSRADHAPIHGIVQMPDGPGPHPTVVVCHGFKGFQEWGFFPPLADLLVARGYAAVRFNFPGTGMLPGDDLVTDLEAFRNARPSQDVEDLLTVLDGLGDTVASGLVDPARVSLVGHSRGGGVALLAAANPRWRDRLKALVTWAGVSTFARWGSADTERWRREGELTILNGRTGQKLPLGVEVLDDIENHPGLDLHAAAGQRVAPWLLAHGAVDPVVPVAEAESLAERTAGVHELRVIENGDHTFGARHPFAGPTREVIQLFNATQTWLARHGKG